MAKHKSISRRTFIKEGTTAAAALGIAPSLLLSRNENKYDSKGLPTRQLGNTGVRIPPIAIGTGSRFCSVEKEEEALQLLQYALDHGFYYWDTANAYRNENVISEVRLGQILADRREEVFLATKIGSRDPDEAKRQIEESLTRLNTDHVDLLQIHSVQSKDDVREFGSKGGVYEVFQDMKMQGITRFIGFTGHTSAEAMKLAATEFEFDTMLIALNHYQEGREKFEGDAVPSALKKGMGVMVMKVVRPRETVENVKTTNLIRYGLSLSRVSACVIGTDSLPVLKQNIQLVQDFQPMNKQEMNDIKMTLAPFYQSKSLDWLDSHYMDGYRA